MKWHNLSSAGIAKRYKVDEYERAYSNSDTFQYLLDGRVNGWISDDGRYYIVRWNNALVPAEWWKVFFRESTEQVFEEVDDVVGYREARDSAESHAEARAKSETG